MWDLITEFAPRDSQKKQNRDFTIISLLFQFCEDRMSGFKVMVKNVSPIRCKLPNKYSRIDPDWVDIILKKSDYFPSFPIHVFPTISHYSPPGFEILIFPRNLPTLLTVKTRAVSISTLVKLKGDIIRLKEHTRDVNNHSDLLPPSSLLVQ